jgi:anti-sigma28 factor (negative regulator of flagellin synthesis)
MDKPPDKSRVNAGQTKNKNGDGTKGPPPDDPQVASAGVSPEKNTLIEQVLQIISETPEIRPEKVDPLKEAIEQETYEIDPRQLANALIIKLLRDP